MLTSMPDINTFTNLGLAGFAIWIMWKMYEASGKERIAASARFKEKDQETFSEIDKREKRNEDNQKVFQDYAAKTHEVLTLQIAENTKALTTFTASVQENIKVLKQVNEHINKNQDKS